ncbi:MAG TPA: DUF1643 domain-containing protein [Pseudomonadales bacterium]|jgi:hypothetical protein|nr:DUF1643 domain-containing protein [Pseudomonadales bacterium]MDP7314298.1 DUF1643 domain-containing protein [Pseudomonadales bacterium]HJL62333.1 DUF1643 domain-containing protein [Pseudomonadales bacterium]|tara:strand:- start:161 stop:688 length:528 start_codon:yes stop_codon:yes gene_type:complete
MTKCNAVDITRSAVFSDCGRFRYSLCRLLKEAKIKSRKTCLFIMLNPSTADEVKDDPTIRRCMGFASSWKYARLEVINLYDFRATYPNELPDPSDLRIGPRHDHYVNNAIKNADLVVCAWGGSRYANAANHVKSMILKIQHHKKTPMCLKKNKDGSPAHPLYLSKELRPVPFVSD